MESQQESLGFLLSDVSRLLRQSFQQRIEGSPLTQAQGRALVYVSRHEGIRQVELAEVLEVQPITLARLIDQLEQSGLVERRPDPTDRRAYLLFVTPAAAPHLAAIRAVGKSLRAEVLRGVDKQEIAALYSALQKMRDNLTSR